MLNVAGCVANDPVAREELHGSHLPERPGRLRPRTLLLLRWQQLKFDTAGLQAQANSGCLQALYNLLWSLN
jgi:hypothetical protein